ncbi:hypothetical protein D3C84_852360 [compost metagenome]
MVTGLGPPRRVEIEEAFLPVALVDPPIVAESSLVEKRSRGAQQVVCCCVAVLAVILNLIGEFLRHQHLPQTQTMIVLIIELALLVDLAIEIDVRRAPRFVAQADTGAEGFGVA